MFVQGGYQNTEDLKGRVQRSSAEGIRWGNAMRYFVWILACASWDASFQAPVSKEANRSSLVTQQQGEFIPGPALHLVYSSTTDLCPQRIWLEALIAFLASSVFLMCAQTIRRVLNAIFHPNLLLLPPYLFIVFSWSITAEWRDFIAPVKKCVQNYKWLCGCPQHPWTVISCKMTSGMLTGCKCRVNLAR